jgi:hypothetical protein
MHRGDFMLKSDPKPPLFEARRSRHLERKLGCVWFGRFREGIFLIICV